MDEVIPSVRSICSSKKDHKSRHSSLVIIFLEFSHQQPDSLLCVRAERDCKKDEGHPCQIVENNKMKNGVGGLI